MQRNHRSETASSDTRPAQAQAIAASDPGPPPSDRFRPYPPAPAVPPDPATAQEKPIPVSGDSPIPAAATQLHHTCWSTQTYTVGMQGFHPFVRRRDVTRRSSERVHPLLPSSARSLHTAYHHISDLPRNNTLALRGDFALSGGQGDFPAELSNMLGSQQKGPKDHKVSRPVK